MTDDALLTSSLGMIKLSGSTIEGSLFMMILSTFSSSLFVIIVITTLSFTSPCLKMSVNIASSICDINVDDAIIAVSSNSIDAISPSFESPLSLTSSVAVMAILEGIIRVLMILLSISGDGLMLALSISPLLSA